MPDNSRFPVDQILIDFNEEITYGEDQMDVHFPARFPTVILSLRDTDALISLADKIRTSSGGKPLYPMEAIRGKPATRMAGITSPSESTISPPLP